MIAIIFAIFTGALGQNIKKSFLNALYLGGGNRDLIVEKAVLNDIFRGRIIINREPFDSDHQYIYWQLTPIEQHSLFININGQLAENYACSKILSAKRIITSKDTLAVVFILTTTPGYTAHCDAPPLGYAIYHKRPNGQVKVTKNYHLINVGSFGFFNDTLQTISIGNNKTGFILTSGYTGMGEIEVSSILLAIVNDSLYEALNITTHDDNYGMYRPPNPACWSYQSLMNFNKNPRSVWDDLNVVTSGTHNIFDRRTRTSHVERFKEVHHYFFKDKKYIEE
jgi:hypothetical protein